MCSREGGRQATGGKLFSNTDKQGGFTNSVEAGVGHSVLI